MDIQRQRALYVKVGDRRVQAEMDSPSTPNSDGGIYNKAIDDDEEQRRLREEARSASSEAPPSSVEAGIVTPSGTPQSSVPMSGTPASSRRPPLDDNFSSLVASALRRGQRHADKTVANLRKRARARVKILEWQRARRAQLVVERQHQLSRARDTTKRSHSSQAPAWGGAPPPLASTKRGTKTTPVPTYNVFTSGRSDTGAVAGVHCHREFGENHAHRFKSFHLRAQIDAYENFTGGPATTSDACELLDDVALALPRSAPVLRGTLAVVSDLIRQGGVAPATGGGFANTVGGGPAPSAGSTRVEAIHEARRVETLELRLVFDEHGCPLVDRISEAHAHPWICAQVLEPLPTVGGIDVETPVLDEVVELDRVRVIRTKLDVDEGVFDEAPIGDRFGNDVAAHRAPRKNEHRTAAAREDRDQDQAAEPAIRHHASCARRAF